MLIYEVAKSFDLATKQEKVVAKCKRFGLYLVEWPVCATYPTFHIRTRYLLFYEKFGQLETEGIITLNPQGYNTNLRTRTLQKLLILIPLAIASYSVYGQDNTIQLKGKIITLGNDVSDILVVNLNSKKSTITDSLGLFTIEVRPRDSVQFSAVQYLTKQIVITDSIFDQKAILINLIDNIIDLREVIVMPYNLSGKLNLDIESLDIEPAVNSSKLGLPNADLYIMTQSERLLLEADRRKYVNYYGLALTINTHKIMNRLSGRTKTFKDMVARDENMELEKEIISKFSKETMSESFDIQLKNIDGFLTFCLAQTDFPELSKASGTEETWEYLRTKSIEYKRK